MPKRTDIKSILVIGAGPIIIGQACEFDYSGVQACRALKAQGYRVILVNSNPATIMTDPELADATYIEPVTWQVVAQIIEKERPDAVLPTMGGQTALNCAMDLANQGVLDMYGVLLIGANQQAIYKAEDRAAFRQTMTEIGLQVPRSDVASNINEALKIQEQFGYPTIIRPSFTLGGSGGGIAYNRDEFITICEKGLELSPTQQVLIEESFLGWKEYELEVVRDSKDNCIIVCTIENIDPMGVHTGDSVTVAPAQTLTDKEYQQLRDASLLILREIGVETGGSNVQFAIHPTTGQQVVIEMNPRVSRSSALASKATGFPIAKIATLLAVGFTLDELQNDMTGGLTPASFEPTIDYVVTKIPRFNFEKFPEHQECLTTQMKSVGEVMAIGTSFQASLQKALCGLEVGLTGLNPVELHDPHQTLKIPNSKRLLQIAQAFRQGLELEIIQELTGVDPWFLAQIQGLIEVEQQISQKGLKGLTAEDLRRYKKLGFSDARIAELVHVVENTIRAYRLSIGCHTNYRRIDSCAAEFPAKTAYLYSCFEPHCESEVTDKPKVIVLGGGPNRIGQGIEFDYCCVHAIAAIRAFGYEAIMVNCNPETVSTDYDISDRLYFEALTLESVMDIVEKEKPLGVIIQFGGQTPLKLAKKLQAFGVPILGSQPEAIDMAEDRKRFGAILDALQIKQPIHCTVTSLEEGKQKAEELGYPLVVRPSYVLGGRAMEVVYNPKQLETYLKTAVDMNPDSPVLLDRFLENAVEVDVDAIVDGTGAVFVAGIMEHVEQAGVHSGDSCCSIPPFGLSSTLQYDLQQKMGDIARKLKVCGLMNAQFAIHKGDIYVLEVNPRASRTVPFVSKSIGLPLSKIAVYCMLGQSLEAQGVVKERLPKHYSVKYPVFPFDKFPGTDPFLGPEMKSTGEAMGIGSSFVEAFSKGMQAVGLQFKNRQRAFISIKDQEKPLAQALARDLVELGYTLVATKGTGTVLRQARIPCQIVHKVSEGKPHIVEMIRNGEIDFIINTTESRQSISDAHAICVAAVEQQVNYTTTLAGARVIIASLKEEGKPKNIRQLQKLHEEVGVAS